MIAGEPVRGMDYRLYREFLHAMETARTRLAVAIAAENKVTPRERWHYYLDMEDRMRRCVREIRRHRQKNQGRQADWYQALSLLKQPLPIAGTRFRGEAQQLCHRLADVLAIMEDRSIPDLP